MKNILLILSVVYCSVCFGQAKTDIDQLLVSWHKAAADADFEAYFGRMTNDAIFIGTDPTENWSYEAFKSFAKPYFDKGKAWSFSTLERNIFVKEGDTLAWFDELLDTQMGICRGSGVVEKTTDGWKVKHYVLSIAIPNENVAEITKMKQNFDTTLMQQLRAGKN